MRCAALLLISTASWSVPNQQSPSRPAPVPDQPPKAVVKEKASTDELRIQFDRDMEKQGIVIDRSRKLAAIRGRFNAPKQSLEYLITAPHGSHYESLISIDARPSNIAASLISLNIDEGSAPERKLKNPKPTEDELKNGATIYDVTSGFGGGVFIYIEWNDDRGFHRHRIEDLVFERPEGRTIPNAKFIFINSVMTEPQSKRDVPMYDANISGNFCTCGFNRGSVLTYPKPHPYAMEGDFDVYQPNWTLVPSEQLPVTLILSAEELLQPLIPAIAPPPTSAPASRPESRSEK
ncbi:MAG: hypothetical protein HY286_16020 [Planctomycetes bacterium]|nr:hypothetical protein [Planctomycetota bacterium]